MFVEICAARAVAERGPRLQKLQGLANKLADIDPQEEGFFLLFVQWLTDLLAAGERQTIPEVTHRVIPQAYYRMIWLMLTAMGGQTKLLGKIVDTNRKIFSGALTEVADRQKGMFEDLRRLTAMRIRGKVRGIHACNQGQKQALGGQSDLELPLLPGEVGDLVGNCAQRW